MEAEIWPGIEQATGGVYEVVERCLVAAERPLRCDRDDWGLSFFSVSPGQNQLFSCSCRLLCLASLGVTSDHGFEGLEDHRSRACGALLV